MLYQLSYVPVNGILDQDDHTLPVAGSVARAVPVSVAGYCHQAVKISIHHVATAVAVAGALSLAGCGTPGTGVDTSRSDRSSADPATTAGDVPDTTTDSGSAPVATAAPTTTDPRATEPTEPPATDAPTTTATTTTTTTVVERPPAPAASGLGSVSADDLASVFLPLNPELLGPSSDLTDGRDAQTFIDEEMTFSGMAPAIEIAGAPITLAGYNLVDPTFDESGTTTSALLLEARHRMAVEVENDDIEGFAESLRDELRPIVEAANPGEVVTDTLGEAPLGNSIFGLSVGPEDAPTTTIEIQQHYVIVPRPVNDLLLSVDVRRTVQGDATVASALPGRDRFVDADLQTQIDLLAAVPSPVSAPVLRIHSVLRNLPSAGAASVNRAADFSVALPTDGFDAYVEGFAAVVEADRFEAVENFGNRRSFDHVEERIDSEFVVELDDTDAAFISVQGDITAYPD